ncbi:MAG TPA: adenine deaminase [Bacillota bacterium]|nr:adenine deaminase [Bacillota bacterium]
MLILFAEELKAISEVARGARPPSLLLRGGRVANLFTREISVADVAIAGTIIAGVGSGYPGGGEVIDASGGIIIPGFIDAHIHLESTLLLPAHFAAVTLPHGTTAVICDPHEIANVLGEAGIYFLLQATEELPLDFYFMAPSCVPATELDTAGGEIGPEQVERLLDHPRVLGLAEMMNYPGVIAGDAAVAAKIAAAHRRGKPVDGHIPGIGGRLLQAYLGAGISSEHECISAEEALEKVRYGMKIIIREGSAARNLADLLPAVNAAGSRNFMFGSDDKEAAELIAAGHMDEILRRAVAQGCDPLEAVEMATLNPARHYGLARRGAVAPGYWADLLVVDDLRKFNVQLVIKNGRVVAREGKLTAAIPSPQIDSSVLHTVKLPRPLRADDFEFSAGPGKLPVIGIIPEQVVTEKLMLQPRRDESGAVRSDPERDVIKIAVIERHRGSGRMSLGLVRGLGLRSGAIASSVAHDSHNIIVAGVEERAMAAAANELARAGGGFAAVDGDGALRAIMPLPVAGLISMEPAAKVAEEMAVVTYAARSLGATPRHPFMTLSFLALPVIPHLKITDRGIFDVDSFSYIEPA